MRRFFLILCILSGGIPWAWADDSVLDTHMMVPELISHTIMGGMVKSVTWADPDKGTSSEIVVLDAAKRTIHILVTSTTTLWDADDKAIQSDKIVPKSKVNVIYLTTDEGVQVAKSIKILK